MDWEARADLAERMWPVAASFACLVHEGDAQGIAAFLKAFDPDEADALAIVLAAMIPVETTSVGDLLAWVGGPPPDPELPLEWPRDAVPGLEPCGTYAAHTRHKKRGEPVDEACRLAYLEYHRPYARESMARRRAREKAAREADDAAA